MLGADTPIELRNKIVNTFIQTDRFFFVVLRLNI